MISLHYIFGVYEKILSASVFKIMKVIKYITDDTENSCDDSDKK